MSVKPLVIRRWAIASLAVGLSMPGAQARCQEERFLPPSAVNAKLDSLERIALTSRNADQRRAAVTRLSAPGWMRSDREGPREVRYPGVVTRLARVYRQSDDYWTRYSIIRLLIPQVERTQAVGVLEHIAREPGPDTATPPGVAVIEDKWSLQTLAIGALARMGADGAESLRRLHASGSVQDATARAALAHLAAREFRSDSGSS